MNNGHHYRLRSSSRGRASWDPPPQDFAGRSRREKSSSPQGFVRRSQRENSSSPQDFVGRSQREDSSSPQSFSDWPEWSLRDGVENITFNQTLLTEDRESRKVSERQVRLHCKSKMATSDYYSTEEDSLKTPTTAYEIYKNSGDWWNAFPKTDYTYSNASTCRYELAPGIMAMPNMSRRSLHPNSSYDVGSHSSVYSAVPSQQSLWERSTSPLFPTVPHVKRLSYIFPEPPKPHIVRRAFTYTYQKITSASQFFFNTSSLSRISAWGSQSSKKLMRKQKPENCGDSDSDYFEASYEYEDENIHFMRHLTKITWWKTWLKKLSEMSWKMIMIVTTFVGLLTEKKLEENVTVTSSSDLTVTSSSDVDEVTEENLTKSQTSAKTIAPTPGIWTPELKTSVFKHLRNLAIIILMGSFLWFLLMSDFKNSLLSWNDEMNQKKMYNLDKINGDMKQLYSNLERRTDHIEQVFRYQEATIRKLYEEMSTTHNCKVEDVRKVVKEMLKVYDADKTARVDFALESAGGQVISTRCTTNYDTKIRSYTFFGFTLYSDSYTPRTVIQGQKIQPGVCWAFQDFPGYLVIKTRSPIHVTGFTVEHAPKSILPNHDMKSAPRVFSVYGLEDEYDKNAVKFGEYEFSDLEEGLQYFEVQNKLIKEAYGLVELRIDSNHGQLDYTCLYRFRIHGETAQ